MANGQRYKVALLFGPPGSGKGTQGKILGAIPGFRHLATGDMFRALDKSSELGQRVVQYSSKGELVPDEVTVELWKDHLQSLIKSGVYNPATDLLMLDGIPRSTGQAEMIASHVEVLSVLHLRPPDMEAMVQRMKRRALKEGRRDDADEGVIRRRFQVYEEETAPVLGCYANGLVTDVDPIGMPVEVLHAALDVLIPLYAKNFANPLV